MQWEESSEGERLPWHWSRYGRLVGAAPRTIVAKELLSFTHDVRFLIVIVRVLRAQ